MSDIKLVTSSKAIDNLFVEAIKILHDKVNYNLSYLGMSCIRRIRDRDGQSSWYDRTGNLRSSIGFAIYGEGKKQIESAFESVLGGQEGSVKGRKMVEDLASKYSDTYALVVVAAMNYAEYVEAIESKDVLASTEVWAKQEVTKYLNKAIAEAENEIRKLEVAL